MTGKVLLPVFAVGSVFCGIAHATFLPQLDWISLAFIFSGAAIVILQAATKINITKDGVTVDLVQAKALATIPEMGVGGKGNNLTRELNPGTEDPDDPEKGKWGGHDTSNGVRLSASVKALNPNQTLFSINIFVSAIQKGSKLTGNVTFHLHPTFKTPVRVVPAVNGVAHLTCVAWGAFTVGAEVENPEAKLELDLSTLPDAPEVFRAN